jgi:hypothetical protein
MAICAYVVVVGIFTTRGSVMAAPECRPKIVGCDATPSPVKIRFRGVTLVVSREHAPVYEAARDLLVRKLEGVGREALRRWIETWEENCDG